MLLPLSLETRCYLGCRDPSGGTPVPQEGTNILPYIILLSNSAILLPEWRWIPTMLPFRHLQCVIHKHSFPKYCGIDSIHGSIKYNSCRYFSFFLFHSSFVFPHNIEPSSFSAWYCGQTVKITNIQLNHFSSLPSKSCVKNFHVWNNTFRTTGNPIVQAIFGLQLTNTWLFTLILYFTKQG